MEVVQAVGARCRPPGTGGRAVQGEAHQGMPGPDRHLLGVGPGRDPLATLSTLVAMLALEVAGARLDRCEALSSATVLSLLRTTDLARAR